VQHKHSVKVIVDNWEVPVGTEDLPQDPDSDETLYGKNKDIMDCSCKKFGDLVRINNQIVVARKYISMLRESVSMAFGRKFLHNFEIVNRLLRNVEALLTKSPSSLAEKQEEVGKLNKVAAALFAKWDNVFSQELFFANGSKEATMASTYAVNKGTLLEGGRGVYTWRVLCDNIVAIYDLGVVSPTHTPSHFSSNPNTPTAWGIRCNGGNGYPIINGKGQPADVKYVFKTGDVLAFSLDSHGGTLAISINDEYKATIPGVIFPVHVAFSAAANARARLL